MSCVRLDFSLFQSEISDGGFKLFAFARPPRCQATELKHDASEVRTADGRYGPDAKSGMGRTRSAQDAQRAC